MTLFVLATPLMALGGLMAWMQRVEARLTADAPARVDSEPADTRAARRPATASATSPALAAAPLAIAIVAAITAASALIRVSA